MGEKINKDLTQDVRDVSIHSVDPSTVCQRFTGNGLDGNVAVTTQKMY